MATLTADFSNLNGDTGGGVNNHTVPICNAGTNVKPEIPDYAILNNVKLSFAMRDDKWISTGDCYVYAGNSQWGKDKFSIKYDYSTFTVDKEDLSSILSFFNSGAQNVGVCNGNVYLQCHADARRNFYWKDIKIEFDYTVQTYTVTVNPSTGGTVLGEGTYDNQATATLEAKPDPGYKFVKWSNDIEDNPYSFTVTEDVTLTAEWAPKQYTLIYDDGSGNQANGISLKYDEEHKIKHFDDIFSASNYPTWNLIYDDNGATEYFIDSEPIKRTWHNRWRKKGTTTDYGLNQEVSGLSSTDGDEVILQARWKAEAIKTNLSIPIRKYHQFAGWEDSDGNRYYQGDTFTLTTNNSTLIAQWEKIQPRMFVGVDNIKKLFLSKDKEIKKIFVYITPENNGSGTHIEV